MWTLVPSGVQGDWGAERNIPETARRFQGHHLNTALGQGVKIETGTSDILNNPSVIRPSQREHGPGRLPSQEAPVSHRGQQRAGSLVCKASSPNTFSLLPIPCSQVRGCSWQPLHFEIKLTSNQCAPPITVQLFSKTTSVPHLPETCEWPS